MSSAVLYDDVRARYREGRPPVLDGVSLEVREGEHVALLGLNGSGKTTLLAATVGLNPFTGSVLVGGVGVTKASLARVRENVGFVFSVPEDQLLFPRVLDDVAFGLLRRGVARPEAERRARETLQALAIDELVDAAPHELSHGQKQRVALAGALVTGPSLLLLDEPSAGLDPPSKGRLAELLRSLPSTMILATHDLTFAEACCSRFARLEGGRIAEEATKLDGLTAPWVRAARVAEAVRAPEAPRPPPSGEVSRTEA